MYKQTIITTYCFDLMDGLNSRGRRNMRKFIKRVKSMHEQAKKGQDSDPKSAKMKQKDGKTLL